MDESHDHRFTHAKLPVLVGRLDTVIEKLESWEIRVADLGRLRKALDILRRAAEADGYPSDEPSLHELAESIRIAQDFHHIIESLGDGPSSRIAKELQLALSGTVKGVERERRPYQFQSQFLVSAVFARAGVDARATPPDQKGPDYIVQENLVKVVVEVKRPTSERGVFDQLDSARDQITASGHRGIVGIDLSDCIEGIGIERFVTSASEEAYDPWKVHLESYGRRVSGHVWNSVSKRYEPGFSRVIAVWLFGRGWRWRLDDLSAPQLFELHLMYVFASTKHNLWWHLGRRVRNHIEKGLAALGMVTIETAEGDV